MSDSLWPRLTPQRKALFRSQGGPMASVPYTCFPIAPHSRFDPQPFRVLLLRRLWLPLLPTARNCRCGLPQDSCGHHRAACAAAGVLGHRGFAVESAAARICREAAARVSLDVRVQDMDLARPDALDNRRLEIVTDGLAGSRHHARVSPQTRRGSSQSGREPQWCRAGRSSTSQRTDLPGAHGPVRSHPSGCPCRRSRGQVVRGKL